MAGLNGQDFLIYVSADATGATTPVELECQGDTSLTEGEGGGLNSTRYKNCVHTSRSKGVLTMSVEIGSEAPLPAGQTIVMNAHDNAENIWVELKSPTTGALEWKGTFKVFATTLLNAPNDGPASQTYEIRQDGNVTRGVTA